MKSFCRHDWAKWSQLVHAYNGIRQFRQCEKCNKVIWRKVACANDSNLNTFNGKPINQP